MEGRYSARLFVHRFTYPGSETANTVEKWPLSLLLLMGGAFHDATINLVLGDTSQAHSPGDFDAIMLRATKYAVDNNLGDVISQSF